MGPQGVSALSLSLSTPLHPHFSHLMSRTYRPPILSHSSARGNLGSCKKKIQGKREKIAKGRKGEKSHEMCFFPSFLFFSSYFPPFPIFSRNVILKNGQGFQAARLLSRRVFSFLPTPFLLLSFLSSPPLFCHAFPFSNSRS